MISTINEKQKIALDESSSKYDIFEFFQFRKISLFSPGIQITLVTLLYVMTTLGYYFSVQLTGKIDGYSPSVSLLFVPIYEEIIFRGLGLKFFEHHYGKMRAVLFSSVLFGLWHLKNIFWLTPDHLQSQILYTSLFFSPITCLITLKVRSIWPAVVIHYLNNFPIEQWFNYLKKIESHF